MKNIKFLFIAIIATLSFISCEKESVNDKVTDYGYHAHILAPNTENKFVGDTLPVKITFESHKGQAVKDISVKIYNKESNENIYQKSQSVNEKSGIYTFEDTFMLTHSNGVMDHSNWIIEASVWADDLTGSKVTEKVAFHVHPKGHGGHHGMGNVTVVFDTKVGDKTISIVEAGNKDYVFTEGNQEFNISKYGYYVSKIQLMGEQHYHDSIMVNRDTSMGYYHVNSYTEGSDVINLKHVGTGKYNKIKFTIGVSEEGVEEGALGGILDQANGAWFWNWNSGFIGFAVEGNASNSGQDYKDFGNGNEVLAGTYAVHVGGWKDIEPVEGQDPKFVNNVKEIVLDLGTDIMVMKDGSPMIHINADLSTFLKDIDFSTTYSVHSPAKGKPFAEKLPNVFTVDHVHQ